MEDFFGLSLSVQVSLGAGYLAYVTAYAGLRQHHNARDEVFISIAFASVAMLAFVYAEPSGEWVGAAAGLVAALVVGGLWRAAGRSLWYGAMTRMKIHGDDGTHTAWQSMIHDRKFNVAQLSVHTKDGRVLYMNDRRPFRGAPHGGIIMGGAGDILMVVEEEELPDGTEEVRTGIVAEEGVRFSYIPADQIARVNVRVQP